MMWLAKIPALFAGNGLIIALMAAGGVMLATWRHDIKESGRQEVQASIYRKSNDNAKKADAARRDAERLPASRLCDKYARDC
jgi:hypothetical protein